jgi:hypothetical protein
VALLLAKLPRLAVVSPRAGVFAATSSTRRLAMAVLPLAFITVWL